MSRASANYGGSIVSLNSEEYPEINNPFEDPEISSFPDLYSDVIIGVSWRYGVRTVYEKIQDWLHHPLLPVDNSWDDWFHLPQVQGPGWVTYTLKEEMEEVTGDNNNQHDTSEDEPEMSHSDEPSGLWGVNQWEDHMEEAYDPVDDEPVQETDEDEWKDLMDEVLYPEGDHLVQEGIESELEAIMDEIINPEDGNFVQEDDVIPEDDHDSEQDASDHDMSISDSEDPMVGNLVDGDDEISDDEVSDDEISDDGRDPDQDYSDLDMVISDDDQ